MIALPIGAPVPRLSVVVPVRNAGTMLPRGLDALAASDLPRRDWELIVIDDASDDDSVTAAARKADVVIRLPARARGPAYARNRGLELARAPIVVFVDPDVLVRPDTLSRMLDALETNPGLSAVFSVYDGEAPVAGVLSRYWNLLHQVAALRHGGTGSVGGAACWAVRRDAITAVGMFDEWRFHGPLGEDLELGHRLRMNGHRIWRDRSIVVTHQRRWSLRDIVKDIWGRGVLLSRLLGPRAALEAARGDVLHVLAHPAALAAAAAGLVSAPILRLAGAGTGATILGATAVFLFMHVMLLSIYATRRGLLFGGFMVPMHLLVQLVAVTAVGYGWFLRNVVGDPHPDPTTQAYAEVGVRMWPPVPQRR